MGGKCPFCGAVRSIPGYNYTCDTISYPGIIRGQHCYEAELVRKDELLWMVVGQKDKIHKTLDELQDTIESWWQTHFANGKVPDLFLSCLANLRNEINKLRTLKLVEE